MVAQAKNLHGSAASSIAACPFFKAAADGDSEKLQEMARKILREKPDADALARAEVVLTQAVSGPDPKGEAHALLGLCHFLAGNYDEAKAAMQVALKAQPKNEDWKNLLERASRNSISKIGERDLPTEKFDASALLLPPALHNRAPLDIKDLPPGPSGVGALFGKVRDIGGAAVGAVLGAVFKFVGRKGPEAMWKSWPERKLHIVADVEIGAIRDWMNANTLKNPEKSALVGKQQPGQKRPEWTERFRSATGAWTTDNPMEGAAGAVFGWQSVDPMDKVRKSRLDDPDLPSVREVSRVLFTNDGPRAEAPFLNNLAIAWIQFQNHDWVSHRQSDAGEGTISVKLAADDPLRTKYGQETMEFRRTQPNSISPNEYTYQNEVSGWWDGGQIYGNDQATQDMLRMGPDGEFLADGKLAINADGTLPVDSKTGVEQTGFSRNWWAGLSIFHTLFVKHHNHICDELKKAHPDWSTDQLFHTARLVNSAIMAKIHTIEWTPAVLPTKELATGMSANWHGLLETMFNKFGERTPHNWYEPTNPVIGGLVGGKRNNYGVPHNLSEQFTEVYRLHSGMPDEIQIRKIGAEKAEKTAHVDATREQGARKLVEDIGMDNLINSFGYQKMPALVSNNFPKFMQDMSVEGQAVFDLGAADLLRARERGVPPYNEFRRQLGLPAISKFEDLKCDEATVAKLKSLYGEDGVEKMDLLAGTLAEGDRPLKGFGQTLFAIFVQMASRRLQADPFFTEKFTEQYYSKEGIELVNKATLKDLLLMHYPDLAKSGLTGVNNAFEPWGTTAKTHPEEHPLTAIAEKY